MIILKKLVQKIQLFSRKTWCKNKLKLIFKKGQASQESKQKNEIVFNFQLVIKIFHKFLILIYIQ